MMIYYWAMSVLDNALLSGVEHGYMQISFTKQLKKKNIIYIHIRYT